MYHKTVRNTYNIRVIYIRGCINEKVAISRYYCIRASFLLGACGGNNGGSGSGSDLKGSAKGEGSSTVAPIVEKLNEKWAKDHKDAKISSGQAGTGAGFQKFIAGETDFSDASRPIKDEEKKN